MEGKSALDGIRVIDATEALAGPFCTMLLGDLGADVVKIERPGTGDMSRGWAPPYVGTESAYFLGVNRNKRGLTLNLKHAKAQAILHRLIEDCDVFVVSQPSLDSLRRLSADPATLCTLNPRLIYCAISGFGMTGPEAGEGGYDIVAQARGGLMALTGEPGTGPMRYPIPLSDVTCGVYSVIGILSALFARGQTGRGQLVDMALLDTQVSWLTNVAASYLATGHRPQKLGNAHPTVVPYQPFKARDKYVVVAVGSEPQWRRLCQVLEIDNTVGADPRFATNRDRLKHRETLVPILEQVFAQNDSEWWLGLLRAADIPCGPINEVDEVLHDPQVLARGMVIEQIHLTAGAVRSVGNPVHLSETPVSYRLPPPTSGQHTVEILTDLGYGSAEIDQLRCEGAI